MAKRRYRLGAINDQGDHYFFKDPAHDKALELYVKDDQGYVKRSKALLTRGGTTSVRNVQGIDVDEHGNVYYLMTYAGTTTSLQGNTARIVKLDDELNFVDEVGPGGWVKRKYRDLRCARSGNLYLFSGGGTTAHTAYLFDDELTAYRNLGTTLA